MEEIGGNTMRKIRNIVLAAISVIVSGTVALTAYADTTNKEATVSVNQVKEETTDVVDTVGVERCSTRPILPVDAERTMFGRQYTLKGLTAGGAGIYTGDENDRTRDYVVKALDEAGIDNTMTDTDKVEAINDYLCEKLEYANYAAVKGFSYKEDWLPFTDYCLLSDKAVCAGYAEAFQSMCISVGIECYYVTGNVYQDSAPEGIYHAWNRVTVGETSYYIDVCWNDSSNDAYFLSANGWEDHEIEEEQEVYRISGQVFPMPEYINE